MPAASLGLRYGFASEASAFASAFGGPLRGPFAIVDNKKIKFTQNRFIGVT
jgi:hypothetical protein